MPTVPSRDDARRIARLTGAPNIPCSRCGVHLRYPDAVPANLGPEWVGFAHNPDLCQPDDIAEKARRDMAPIGRAWQ